MARATVSRGRRTAKSGGKPAQGNVKRKKPDPRRDGATDRATKAKKAPPRKPERAVPAAPVDDRPRLRAAPPPIDHDIDPAVLEFISAIETYRLAHARPFPSWSEVLHVLRTLGYKKA